jgi:hypothetical protein
MRERPVSVTLFGILNIGYGLFGLFGPLLSRADAKLQEAFTDLGTSAAGGLVNSISAFMDALYHNPLYIVWNQITVPLNFMASLLMVAAGVGLLLLKNWARLTSIGLGVYKTILAILNGAVFCLALREILAKTTQGGGALVVIILILAGLVEAVLTLVYPILLLYFMARPKMVQAFQREPVSPPNHE